MIKIKNNKKILIVKNRYVPNLNSFTVVMLGLILIVSNVLFSWLFVVDVFFNFTNCLITFTMLEIHLFSFVEDDAEFAQTMTYHGANGTSTLPARKSVKLYTVPTVFPSDDVQSNGTFSSTPPIDTLGTITAMRWFVLFVFFVLICTRDMTVCASESLISEF